MFGKKEKVQSLNPVKFALAATIISAVVVFLSLLAGILGFFVDCALLIDMWLVAIYGFLGYSGLNVVSLILGTIYVAIDTFVCFFVFAWLYNKLL